MIDAAEGFDDLDREGHESGMIHAELLSSLFAPREAGDSRDLRTFLRTWGPGTVSSSAFERLVRVALKADGRLAAGAAGHQAAIRRLFPDTPDDAIVAFCVSEDKGPRPAHILTTLTSNGAGFSLKGTKRWGSMSPLSDVLYVAASIGESNGRNQLRMVRLPAGCKGLTLDTSAYGSFKDHMPIADLILDDVAVRADDVLSADAYEAYIKPFRLVEDVYGTAATQIGVLGVGLTHEWSQDVLEDLLALILQAHTISQTPMARPEDVVLMSSYFRASDILWARLGECWSKVPNDERARWSPETGTLGVAARARETRRQNAWSEIGAGGRA